MPVTGVTSFHNTDESGAKRRKAERYAGVRERYNNLTFQICVIYKIHWSFCFFAGYMDRLH